MNLVLKSILVAGILDAIAAVIFLGNMNFIGVWKYVASGYFGNNAFKGGNEMVIYGITIHFLITLFWTVLYNFIFKKIDFFTKNKIIGGLIYGIIIWLTMTFIILPVSNIPKSPMTIIVAIKEVLILMICVGLPISLILNVKKD